MTGETPKPDLRKRSTFRHWTTITIRYNDVDTLGHVNNTASGVFLEQARCDALYPMIGEERKGAIDIVIARLIIDYHAELHYPGSVDVGTAVTAVGNKSFHMVHGIFVTGTDHCVTTGEDILVWYDLRKRASMVPPDDLRQGLLRLMTN